MSLVEFQSSYIFSSDPENGAQNLSADGDSFTVNLNDPITIPMNAINATIECVNAAIWFVQPNISEEIGNNHLTFDHNATTYPLVIPDGLYSMDDLNAYLSRQFLAQAPQLPDDLFTFVGDGSTQRTILTFNYVGTQIDFQTVPNSVNTLLGFAPLQYPQFVPSVAGESFTSQDTAALNRLSSYLIHCSLAPNGIPVNAIGSDIVADIPITTDTPPGSQLVYSPYNPIRSPVKNLVGQPVSNIRMSISDQNDRTLDMLNEYWSCLLTIRYWLQVSDSSEERRRYRPSKHDRVH